MQLSFAVTPAVRFAMDRGGLVGADGATHCGAFDVTYMACLPNMVVMAPSNEAELVHMVATSVAIDDRPSCFRWSFWHVSSIWLTEFVPLVVTSVACDGRPCCYEARSLSAVLVASPCGCSVA